MNSKLLLTYQQFSKLRRRVPYTYVLSKNNQYLYYFGGNHSRNYTNKQYQVLQEFWNDFLKQTKDLPQVVMVEGGLAPAYATKKMAVEKSAENGFVSFLARHKHIKPISPEPNLQFEGQELMKKYSQDEIEYYYFARVAYQWNTLPTQRPTFINYVNGFLEKDKKGLSWKNYDFSIEQILAIHERMFHTNFKAENKTFFNNLLNPYKTTKVNRIAAASGRIRDLHILKEIERYWQQGKNIFIAYGSAHAIMQEKVLRNLVIKE